MKKCIYLVLVVILQVILLGFLPVEAGVIKEAPEDLLPAAEKILSKQFSKSRQWYLDFQPYFHHGDSLMDFRLGKPYPFYQLEAEEIYILKDKDNFENTLTFRGWALPVFISEEEEPRTEFVVVEDEGKWQYGGLGGDASCIIEARNKWPLESGYRVAPLYAHRIFGRLIMIEMGDTLFMHICSKDPDAERLFGVSKKSDGYYPPLSLEHLIGHIKGEERYSGNKKGLD